MSIDEWPTDEDMALVCDPAIGGCGHTQGQHEYGDEYAPCCEEGCDCTMMR